MRFTARSVELIPYSMPWASESCETQLSQHMTDVGRMADSVSSQHL